MLFAIQQWKIELLPEVIGVESPVKKDGLKHSFFAGEKPSPSDSFCLHAEALFVVKPVRVAIVHSHSLFVEQAFQIPFRKELEQHIAQFIAYYIEH